MNDIFPSFSSWARDIFEVIRELSLFGLVNSSLHGLTSVIFAGILSYCELTKGCACNLDPKNIVHIV